MSTIVTRAGKGDTLSWTEVDSNFTNLNTDKIQSTNGTGTSGQVLTSNGTTASWQTPSSGSSGNNIITLSTGGTHMDFNTSSGTYQTNVWTLESNGGISGVSVGGSDGRFTLPAGTYIMYIPILRQNSNDGASYSLYDITNSSTKLSMSYVTYTRDGTARYFFEYPYMKLTPTGSTSYAFMTTTTSSGTRYLYAGQADNNTIVLRIEKVA